MSTVLKTFRLPEDCVAFLERESKRHEVSQSRIVTDVLKKKMNFEAQWQCDLLAMANDAVYRKEQAALAEEDYD